jgi:hypothetical protein
MLAGYFHALRERYFLQLRDRGAGTSVATAVGCASARECSRRNGSPSLGPPFTNDPESD